MTVRAMMLLLLLTASGCTGKWQKIEEDYRPLKYVVEQEVWDSEFVVTVGDSLYVTDLKEWNNNHPQGSVVYRASLLHEQVHSSRQKAKGVTRWIAKYETDAAFAWAEEQLGWYKELRALAEGGIQVNAEAAAKLLASYRTLSGAIVTYADALVWVQAVLGGNWHPPEEPKKP